MKIYFKMFLKQNYPHTERAHCIPGKTGPEQSVPRQTLRVRFLQPGKKIKSHKRGGKLLKIPIVKFSASRKRCNTYTIPKDRKCNPRAVPRGLLTQRDSMGNTVPMSLSGEI